MNRERRLGGLETSLQVAAGDEEGLCLKCRGPRGYRRMIDRARARLRGESAPEPEMGPTCRRCGGLTPYGGIQEERTEWGLD
jgi:hypothetical protein